MTFRVNAGAEVNAGSSDRYIPIGLSAGGKLDGDASKSKSNYYTIINENILTYDKRFNKNHALNLMGGVTFQTYQYNDLGGSGTGFLRDVYETNNLGVASTPGTPSSGYSDYRMASFLGRANYNLMERYLLTVTARYDGSSKFSKNHKFAFFPSAALAWRLSEENFMQDIDWLSNLKLRASIGQTGNQSISPYQTFARLGTSGPIFGDGKDIGFGLSSMANDDLKWETTTQTDIGVDFGFFSNRLNIGFDYYWKQTRDLLYNATLPPSSGYSSMLRNLGRIDNKGFEISINTINMKGKVNWTTNLNITSNRSIVKDLGSDVYGNKIQRIDAPIGGGNWFPLFVGKAPFQLYGYEIEGIYQTDEEARLNGEATKKAGDYRYKDTDGKAGITTGDKTIIANTQPKFTFGLTNIINWNNFELSFLLIGSVGGDIVNEFNKSITNIGGTWNIRKDVWENHWTPENPNAKYAPSVPSVHGRRRPGCFRVIMRIACNRNQILSAQINRDIRFTGTREPLRRQRISQFDIFESQIRTVFHPNRTRVTEGQIILGRNRSTCIFGIRIFRSPMVFPDIFCRERMGQRGLPVCEIIYFGFTG